MHRLPIVACYAVASILTIAACSGDDPTSAGSGGAGAAGGGGGADCRQEICDGLDNDCNGAIDDGFGPETCGIGACQTTVETCQNGQAASCVPLNPAPAEACDGIDDDCDGTVDEECTCVDGQTQSCYSGSPETRGTGECHDGSQTCVAGAWGPCMGDATPSPEKCDGKDNDCDAVTDDGNPGGGVTCATGKPGVCASGTMVCTEGTVICVQDVQVSTEVCDGLDNDCDPNTADGAQDPAAGMVCDGADADLCKEGTTVCAASVLACNDANDDDLEVCNGADDDCDPSTADGAQDPGAGVACDGADADLCKEGSTACAAGVLACSDPNDVDLEVCNGADDDCDPSTADGAQDPGAGMPCDGADADLCNEGSLACTAGMLACSDPDDVDLEICNGVDDDCNPGTVDGSADPGLGAACDGPDPGACTDGTQQCSGGAFVCNDPTESEQCNALDENCNGIINDGVPGCGTCAMPHPLPAGGIAGTYQMSGNTTTSGSCGGGGVDRYHTWMPSSSGTASLTVVTDYWPSAVYVRQGSCGGGQVVCDYKPGQWPTHVISFPVTAGTTYYIITDHGSYQGPITLTYTMTLTAP